MVSTQSRPVRGAWIEMAKLLVNCMLAEVAPRKGRVD